MTSRAAETIHYPAASPDVSFAAVAALPVGSPAARFPYGDSPSQFAELWLPVGRGNEQPPLVIFVHGGCWLSEYSIEHSHPLATALTGQGYAVWNIEYRRSGEPGGGFPGSVADIRDAIALLRQSPPTGVDITRAALAGHSAGGHLALLAADDLPVIGLAPIIDITEYARGEGSCNAAAIQFMGATPDQQPQDYRAATPIVTPRDTVLMGSLDTIVPAQTRYLQAGRSHWSAAGHFDWIHPGTPAWTEWLNALQKTLAEADSKTQGPR
jgi:acetyl esterase/lipase